MAYCVMFEGADLYVFCKKNDGFCTYGPKRALMRKSRIAQRLLSVLIIGQLLMSGMALASETEKHLKFDHTHAGWDEVLKKNVLIEGAQSTVDYRSLKQKPAQLDSYLKELESVSQGDFKNFKQENQIAFLTNAYNALTIKLVLDHYPVSSIKKIGGLFSSPWKKRFFKLLGEEHSLDDIEHEMLRKQYSEPRIHFALVCASKGCPSLQNEAFVGKRLDAQLQNAARAFLGDTSRNRYDPPSKTLYVSSIFKWYGEDFVKKFGSLEAYLLPFFTKDSANRPNSGEVSIQYLDYDWSLNEKSP